MLVSKVEMCSVKLYSNERDKSIDYVTLHLFLK